MMKRFQRYCLRIAAIIGALIFFMLTICSWYRTKTLLSGELLKDNRDSLWKSVLIILAVFLAVTLSVKAEKFLSAKLLHIMAVLFSLGATAFGIFLLYSVETYAVADQWYVYEAARRLVDGTFDIQEYARYYQMFSFQLNLAQIYELIFRMTGSSNYRVLQVFHSICVGITLYMGFGTVRELFHRRAAELIYLVLGILFIPMYIYVLFIYGETIGVCCAMTAVWCFLKCNNCESVKGIIGYGILGAIAVTGFYQVRVALTIVWIAMFLIQVMISIVKRKPLPLVMTVCMLLTAVCISGITRSVMEYRTGGGSLDNRMPTVLWVAMGLQENPDRTKGPGSYNAYNWNVFSMTQMDAKASSDIAVEYIKSRLPEFLANPAEGIAFFGRKTMNQWNEPSYGCFIVTSFHNEMDDWVKSLYFAEGNRRCLQFLNEYQAVVYLAVLLGFIRLVFGERSPQEYLLGVILIGGYLFSMVWEARSRYVYPYAVIMIPFAACSLMHCGEVLRNKLIKRSN